MPVLHPTTRLYLYDDRCFEAQVKALAVRDHAIAFDKTCFYPGGGGQPPDRGCAHFTGMEPLEVISVHADDDEVLWHVCRDAPPPVCAGQPARLALDIPRRQVLARYHTVLHVLNTIALRDYGGWITGAQIATDYARIDFNLRALSPALRNDLELKVNAVLARDYALESYSLPEAQFRERGELLRTLEATPPVRDGQVRVVAIRGFDEQACGGTHVHSTAEVGRFSILRTENKGKINKRLYIVLEPPSQAAPTQHRHAPA